MKLRQGEVWREREEPQQYNPPQDGIPAILISVDITFEN